MPLLTAELLEALEEPALLISGQRTLMANSAALALLGRGLVDQNVRFAIRHPQALEAILQRREQSLDVVGIGGVDRRWTVSLKPFPQDLLLIRLRDRSAQRAAERAQVDFVANASHELRTPLASVLGYAETLAEPGALDDDLRRRFGEQIHDQARRMLGIIRDLMSLSRIEADRFSEPREQIFLSRIVEEAVRSALPLAEERGCRIDIDLPPGLSSLRGDAAQLRQVVDNLLHNALRYGCRSTGERVEVRLDGNGGWQRLFVKDHGDGIASEHIPRLTERFYRVDSARSRDNGGTGLGLAIVRQIVERHRGQLKIRSAVGTGTEIEVRLPEV